MARFIVLPLNADPADAEEIMVGVIRQQYPDWRADDADPMTQVLRAAAVIWADVLSSATRVGEEVFRYAGRGIYNDPPQEATLATGTVTITAQDTSGPYEIPDDLTIEGRDALGNPVAFAVVSSGATIANGSTTISLPIEAVEEGTGYNDISGVADFSEYVDYLTGVVFDAPTSGGIDREPDPDYLDRLADDLSAIGRPVLPRDFSLLARRLGAYRATTIDKLDPADGSLDNAATVTQAYIDADGVPLVGVERDRIAAAVEAQREEGWTVHVIDATVNPIDVSYEVTALPDYDPAIVDQAIMDTLGFYLSGATWGLNQTTGETREWLNETVVRRDGIKRAILGVDGVRWIDALVIAAHGGTLATSNVTMTGYAPLPSLDTIVSHVVHEG